MIGAGLLAKKAVERGLTSKPWVKTSLAPGSRVVTDYLEGAGLLPVPRAARLQHRRLRLHDLHRQQRTAARAGRPAHRRALLVAAAVLSGNRNFEARVHPQVRANYLASPMLVVAFALAGRVDIDLSREPLGHRHGRQAGVPQGHLAVARGGSRRPWPRSLKPGVFQQRYGSVFEGDETWQALEVPDGQPVRLGPGRPPTFRSHRSSPTCRAEPAPLRDITGARVLAVLGDSVTTDHISPAGSIPKNGPAARYLLEHGVEQADFNTFGARRGNHEVMMRGTFGNVRIRNALVPGKEGNWTPALPHRRGDLDLRRRDAVPGRQARRW